MMENRTMTTKKTIKAILLVVALGLTLYAISEHRTNNMINYAQANGCKWEHLNGFDVCK